MAPSMIRGLTLLHPWPAMILAGKDVENRSWSPRRAGGAVGMTLAIHGGVAPRPGKNQGYLAYQEALEWVGNGLYSAQRRRQIDLSHAQRYGPVRWLQLTADEVYIRPHIVALVTVAGVSTMSHSPWAVPGAVHWQLSDLQALPEPVPDSGFHQGLWHLQPDALRSIEAQTGRTWEDV